MLAALGYEFPPLSNQLMSEKKLSFANVDTLLVLYFPSLAKEYSSICVEMF